MNNFNSKCFHYWQWFAFNHQEELYEVIMSMVKNYVEEAIPEFIEKYLREYINNLSFDIRTTLNGKSADLTGLKEDIERIILESFK